MKNLVCLKEVADPQDIEVQNGKVYITAPEMIMNPFDEYAVEEVISIQERFGYPALSLTLGVKASSKAIKTAVALGVEKAFEILSDDELDSFSTGVILAKKIRSIINKEKIGLITVGRQSIDQGKGQVGCIIAEELNLPYISNVIEIIQLNEAETIVKRKDENGHQFIRTSLPCVIQVSGGEINEPRMPTIMKLLKTKKYVPESMKVEDIVGAANLIPKVEKMIHPICAELPPPRQKGIIFRGNPDEQVNQLIEKLISIFTSVALIKPDDS